MKNNSTCHLISLILFVTATAVPALATAKGNNNGLPDKIEQLDQRVKKLGYRVRRNNGDIADNFSQIQDNRAGIMDLDERVSELEAGGGSPGGERNFVDVDCTASGDPDALMIDEATSIYFPPNTTYNIHGACNGPLYVTEDGVYFVGVEGTSPAIVLPGYTTNAANGTVFADGASNVRVENLLVDASAWGTLAAQGSEAAGVYARDAFMRLRNVEILGGLYAVNPYRNAIIRLEGGTKISEFVNAGISAGDQSLVTTRGQVDISSNITGSNYMNAIEGYRGGLIDFRGGVTTSFAIENEDAYAVSLSQLSQLRIRDSGEIDVNGPAFVGSTSQLRMDAGDLSGDIYARENSSVFLRNVEQLEGQISLEFNSSANLSNSSLGYLSARSNSSAQVFQGTLLGANLDQGATAFFIGPNLFGDVALFSATFLEFFSNGTGGLNGNKIYKCGEFIVANADPTDLGGEVVDPGCPLFP